MVNASCARTSSARAWLSRVERCRLPRWRAAPVPPRSRPPGHLGLAPRQAPPRRRAGSGVSRVGALKERGRGSHAAPRLRAAGRPLKLDRRRPRRAFGAPPPGARRDGRDQRRVGRVREGGVRLAAPRREPTGRPPSGRAGDGSAPGRRTPSAPPRPRAGAAAGRRSRAARRRATASTGSPVGSAAARSSRRLLSAGNASNRRRKHLFERCLAT